MKLDRFAARCVAAVAFIGASAAFACGCSASTPVPARVAQSSQASIPNAVGTTNLMSAELAGPAPRVGKAHLAIDEDGFDTTSSVSDDENAPKEARRSDGSHRGGGFGTSSK